MMFTQVMNKIEAGKSEPRAVREVSIGTKTAPSEVYYICCVLCIIYCEVYYMYFVLYMVYCARCTAQLLSKYKVL